jgi:hypothetical protein
VIETRLAARVEWIETGSGALCVDCRLRAGDDGPTRGEATEADARGAEEITSGCASSRVDLGTGPRLRLRHCSIL